MPALALYGLLLTASVDELAAQLRSGTWDQRTVAAAMLATHGEQARPAVPALAAALQDPRATSLFRTTATTTLGVLGPAAREAVPALLAIVSNADPERAAEDELWDQARANAAYALGRAGSDDRGRVVPALLAAVPEARGNLRDLALGALETLGLRAEDEAAALPALTRVLQEWKLSTEGQRAAAVLLGRMGPRARSALPALEAALMSRDDGVRQAAVEALRKIQGR
ncbi:MAG TPA: hypothetical protein VFM88_22955 [Vicinamibacteria bacterium]|nr:hypothetical protein [Vicinamibacteria bacterium]